jgi:hypothetical protein
MDILLVLLVFCCTHCPDEGDPCLCIKLPRKQWKSCVFLGHYRYSLQPTTGRDLIFMNLYRTCTAPVITVLWSRNFLFPLRLRLSKSFSSGAGSGSDVSFKTTFYHRFHIKKSIIHVFYERISI